MPLSNAARLAADALAAQRSKQAIRADRWDEFEWQSTRDRLGEPLSDTADALADLNWTAPRLLQDVFLSLTQAAPTLNPTVDPQYKVNRAVTAELLDAESHQDLRRLTVDDPTAAGLACVSLRAHLEQLYRRLADIQRQADEAQAKLDAAREAAEQASQDGPGDGSGDGGGVQAMLDQLAEEAAGAEAGVDAALDDAGAYIGKIARQAMTDAAETVAEERERAATWGVSPGELAAMDPADRLKLAEELDTPDLRAKAAIFGAMRYQAWGDRQRTHVNRPEEVFDVHLSDDISRLLPTELAGLAVPELEDDFFRRYAQGELLCYQMRAVVREAKGPIVYLEDSSSSMFWSGAVRHRWARALGLALLGIAKDEGRAFTAILFGGPGKAVTFDFPAPAEFSYPEMLAYAKAGLVGAGTCFETPLGEALGRLEAEHAATGRVASDVILATDGECEISAGFAARYTEARERLGHKTYAVVIGANPSKSSLNAVCDGGGARIEDLVSGGDVTGIFAALT